MTKLTKRAQEILQDPKAVAIMSKTEITACEDLIKYRSSVAMAKHLGCSNQAISARMQRLELALIRRGYAPQYGLHNPVAPGNKLGFATTEYGPDGSVNRQWVRQAPDSTRLDIIREAMAEVTDQGRGVLAPIKRPHYSDADLLAVYHIVDAHIGLRTWAAEVGESYDIKIATDMYRDLVDRLISQAPEAETGLLANLGDFFHADNARGETTRGTRVDLDSRFALIAARGISLTRYMIDRMLQRHAKVIVWIIEGNHDSNTSIMLALALHAMYEREPRVEIVIDPSSYRVLRFGANLIAATHGNVTKIKQLPLLLAARWPQEWGETTHRIWYHGHIHHDSVIRNTEDPGCVVESLRTSVPADAWHTKSGYFSGRDLKCDVWHREAGRIRRIIETPIINRTLAVTRIGARE